MGSSSEAEEFTPREYQEELLDIAIKQNSIVFLPTGSGKTYIAGMLIKYMSDEVKQKYTEGGKRTFFLVNTVALVAQQAESISRMLPLTIGVYSGDAGVDYWDHEKWRSELDEHQVLVMTAQIFLNLLLHCYFKMEEANLLIMDECHHATNNHSMKQIMDLYRVAEYGRPKILGLTATLLNANCKTSRIENEIKTLEFNLDSKVITATNEVMVQKFSTNPREKVQFYSSDSNVGTHLIVKYLTCIENIISSIKLEVVECPMEGAEILDPKKPLNKKLLNMIKDIKKNFDDLGLYGATDCALVVIIRLERIKISCQDSSICFLLDIVTTKLHHFRNKAFTFMRAAHNDSEIPFIYSSPKLKALFDILGNFSTKNTAIVFVERRTTAKVLFYMFNRLSNRDQRFREVKCDFIVGFNNNPFNDTREALYYKKGNLCTLRKFNNKETNVLFASDVIEEGIDVTICNFVIKFDLPITFRSYIQSKGRARNKESTFILLMPENNKQASDNFQRFKVIETYMKQYLTGEKSIYNLGNNEAKQGCIDDDDIQPYYVDGAGTATVTALSAISLLNRYCQELPQDKFCSLTINWWLMEDKFNRSKPFKAILQLPMNSSIKTNITGPACCNKLNAKRAAALEACKMLHMNGDLDSNLLPCGRKSDLLEDPMLFPHWITNESIAGTRKFKRNYTKQYSKWECECRPRPKTQLYIHFIRIKPNYERPAKSRLAAFFDILNSNQTFALLTTKKWPKICKFSLFLNVGEINIEILENVKEVKLSQLEINCLFNFHCLLFTDILQSQKKYVMRDYDNLENSYFVIPAVEEKNGEINIDWETVKKHKKLPELAPLSEESRKRLVVTEKNYLGKVVVPWYRSKEYNMMKYIVTRISPEVPDSPFPSANYESYAQYFQQRYNENVLNPNQSLIEVRAISSKLNCLLPRGKRQSSRRKDEDDFEETLIPELCCLIDFPAVYMLKVTALPSIMHRINFLLIAEEFRQKIANELKLEISAGHTMDPLRVDKSSMQSEDKSQVHSTIEISDLLTSNMNALKDKMYPWKEEEEPNDIDRSIHNIDILSVLHFEKFISMSVEEFNCNNISKTNSKEEFIEAPTAHLNLLNVSEKNCTGPQQSTILQVLTAATAADIINYERLETLGDSYLKYIVSLALFICYSSKDEGKLTEVKGKILGNKNLYYVGSHLGLGRMMKVYEFSPNDWDAPCLTLSKDIKNIVKEYKLPPSLVYHITFSQLERDTGLLNEHTRQQLHELITVAQESEDNSQENWVVTGQQVVRDKTIADAIEALIGAYLQNCGVSGALKLCHWLEILPPQIFELKTLLIDPAETAVLNKASNIDEYLIEPDNLERTLGYRFKDRSFLLQALTHPSFRNNTTDCYQRLEFLGDALLDFLVTVHIYENCGNLSPGDLTDLRSALVNNVTFACLAVRNDFNKHLNLRGNKLNEVITKFVKIQEIRNHKIGPEIFFLVQEKDVMVVECVDVPKVLGDVFEAIAGAIFLDSGKSLQQVWNVYYNLMKKEIHEFSLNVPKNHIRLLYEKFPSPVPKFGELKIVGSEVLIPLEVTYNSKPYFFHGVGENKKLAKLAAAKLALRYLHGKDSEV